MTKLLHITVSLLAVMLGLTACVGTTTRLNPVATQESIDNLRSKDNVQVVQRGETLRILLATDDCFDLYTTTILSSCRPALNAIAKVLAGYGGAPITVAGYTDAVAGPRESIILSRRQAESVVAYLWVQGIPYQRMQSVGYGTQNPIGSNLNTEDSYYNRRIEISVRSMPEQNFKKVAVSSGDCCVVTRTTQN